MVAIASRGAAPIVAAALAGLATAWLCGGCALEQSPTPALDARELEQVGRGQVQLWLTIDDADLADLDSLSLVPEWAGAGSGPVRDEGWQLLPVTAALVHLAASDSGQRAAAARDEAEATAAAGAATLRVDGASLAACGYLPAGRYDRVHVHASVVAGVDASGIEQLVTSHIEPIARGFELRPGQRVAVEIGVVTLPGSSISSGRREVFVKGARLIEPAPQVGCDG